MRHIRINRRSTRHVIIKLVRRPPIRTTTFEPLKLLTRLKSRRRRLLTQVYPRMNRRNPRVNALLPIITKRLTRRQTLPVRRFIIQSQRRMILTPNVSRHRDRFIIIPLPISQLTNRVTRQVIRPTRIPLRSRARTTRINNSNRPQPHNKFFNSNRDPKRSLMSHHVRLLSRLRHVRILPTSMNIKQPLSFFTKMIRMRRKNRDISPRTISIRLLTPMRNINSRRITRLQTSRIRRMHTPIQIFATRQINILMRQYSVRPNRYRIILKRINKSPISRSPSPHLIRSISRMTRIIKNARTHNKYMMDTSLVTPKPTRQVLRSQRRLRINRTIHRSMINRLFDRLPMTRALSPQARVCLMSTRKTNISQILNPNLRPNHIIPFMIANRRRKNNNQQSLNNLNRQVNLRSTRAITPSSLRLMTNPHPSLKSRRLPRPTTTRQPRENNNTIPMVRITSRPSSLHIKHPRHRHRPPRQAIRHFMSVLVHTRRIPRLLITTLNSRILVSLARHKGRTMKIIYKRLIPTMNRHRSMIKSIHTHRLNSPRPNILILRQLILSTSRSISHNHIKSRRPSNRTVNINI